MTCGVLCLHCENWLQVHQNRGIDFPGFAVSSRFTAKARSGDLHREYITSTCTLVEYDNMDNPANERRILSSGAPFVGLPLQREFDQSIDEFR